MPRKPKLKSPPAKFKSGFLSDLDGRTDLARQLRQNYQEIVEDVGGTAGVGHVKASLIERFCWLEAILADLEQSMASGEISKTEGVGRWIQAVNSLSGLAKVLGVERQRKAIDLQSYVEAKS